MNKYSRLKELKREDLRLVLESVTSLMLKYLSELLENTSEDVEIVLENGKKFEKLLKIFTDFLTIHLRRIVLDDKIMIDIERFRSSLENYAVTIGNLENEKFRKLKKVRSFFIRLQSSRMNCLMGLKYILRCLLLLKKYLI